MKKLTVKEVERIAFRLAKEAMSFNEPIPEFSTRFPNALESCLANPFQTFSGKYLYSSFTSKAAILFYLMIKNHPFKNGNKRIAMTTLFVFLHKNKRWLKVNVQELYNFAMWATNSPPKFKKEALEATEKFIKEYIVELKQL